MLELFKLTPTHISYTRVLSAPICQVLHLRNILQCEQRPHHQAENSGHPEVGIMMKVQKAAKLLVFLYSLPLAALWTFPAWFSQQVNVRYKHVSNGLYSGKLNILAPAFSEKILIWCQFCPTDACSLFGLGTWPLATIQRKQTSPKTKWKLLVLNGVITSMYKSQKMTSVDDIYILILRCYKSTPHSFFQLCHVLLTIDAVYRQIATIFDFISILWTSTNSLAHGLESQIWWIISVEENLIKRAWFDSLINQTWFPVGIAPFQRIAVLFREHFIHQSFHSLWCGF